MSFTVFQDSPDTRHDDHHATATDTPATLLSAIEKENLHPVTGQRAGPTIGSEAKKRKTAALATKVLPAPASKKHKELKAEPKKSRKPRSTDAKKNTKSSRSSRRTSPLPPVAEEREVLRQPPRLSITQTDIDSRCYELTVSPLADVSEAYDPTRSESQEPDVHNEMESVVDDYFSPRTANKSFSTISDPPCTADDASRYASEFSTPERKRVYSAFTFSSPSPTSERFKQAQVPPTRRD